MKLVEWNVSFYRQEQNKFVAVTEKSIFATTPLEALGSAVMRAPRYVITGPFLVEIAPEPFYKNWGY